MVVPETVVGVEYGGEGQGDQGVQQLAQHKQYLGLRPVSKFLNKCKKGFFILSGSVCFLFVCLFVCLSVRLYLVCFQSTSKRLNRSGPSFVWDLTWPQEGCMDAQNPTDSVKRFWFLLNLENARKNIIKSASFFYARIDSAKIKGRNRKCVRSFHQAYLIYILFIKC